MASTATPLGRKRKLGSDSPANQAAEVWAASSSLTGNPPARCFTFGAPSSVGRASISTPSLPPPVAPPGFTPPPEGPVLRLPRFGNSAPLPPKRPAVTLPPSTGRRPSVVWTTARNAEPPAKKMRFDFLNLVHIQVGDGAAAHRFQVPQNIVDARSPFLSRQNAQSQSCGTLEAPLALPDVEPKVFATWMQLAFQDELIVDEESQVHECSEQWVLVIKTHLLAEKLGDIKGANTIMDEILRRLRTPISTTHVLPVKYTFEATKPGSKLRTVFVDYAVYTTTDTAFFNNASYEFLQLVSLEFLSWREKHASSLKVSIFDPNAFRMDKRAYHIEAMTSAT